MKDSEWVVEEHGKEMIVWTNELVIRVVDGVVQEMRTLIPFIDSHPWPFFVFVNRGKKIFGKSIIAELLNEQQ